MNSALPADSKAEPRLSASGRRRIVLLGSTGSIGTQALDVIAAAPDRFEVIALAAGDGNLARLAEQVVRHHVSHVAVPTDQAAAELTDRLTELRPPGSGPGARPETRSTEILAGPTATAELATIDCDIVLNGVAGAQGLRATLAALHADRVVALANKESLIAGGSLVLNAAKPGQLVPVDSEHSALAQALRGGTPTEVRRLVLTASGGPFRGRSRADLTDVTPKDALAHPTWSMGRLITTNSATLVNKGLELIEAKLLFDVGYDQIDVVVHPQSMIHSMVEFTDGSTLAQTSPPDMRLPIALALGWPDRVPGAAKGMDWTTAHTWTFEPLDNDAFPAVELARTAGRAAGCAPAVYNAANELLVEAFHDGRCGFLTITDVIAQVLSKWLEHEHAAVGEPRDIADIEAAEEWARRAAAAALALE